MTSEQPEQPAVVQEAAKPSFQEGVEQKEAAPKGPCNADTR